jgi:hypothetical protein
VILVRPNCTAMTWADTEPLAGHWPTVSAVPVCTAQCHCAFIFRSTDFSVWYKPFTVYEPHRQYVLPRQDVGMG